MDRCEAIFEAAVDDVWATLADVHTYPNWLVGCKAIRHVEGEWPEAGSLMHHTVGVGPATIDDTTTIDRCEPRSRLVLRARVRPLGVVLVDISLTEGDDGRATVVMEEGVVAGPAKHIPHQLTDPVIHARNAESLRQLKAFAERRASTA